ncbi:hypothetical protein CW706_03095 [Candidatus Bathyarchaeota archaeon]|nr:MAG: hypothetical protein CW706_03095 [Candidatus Bathyarchaeota archaeon]
MCFKTRNPIKGIERYRRSHRSMTMLRSFKTRNPIKGIESLRCSTLWLFTLPRNFEAIRNKNSKILEQVS